MTKDACLFLMTVAGTVCWAVCFWWMYRISAKQNALLAELRDQNVRIERLSRAEHELIKEVHPQVGEIKESMEVVIAAVKEVTDSNVAAKKETAENAITPMMSPRG